VGRFLPLTQNFDQGRSGSAPMALANFLPQPPFFQY
jgi:hypothetical protein